MYDSHACIWVWKLKVIITYDFRAPKKQPDSISIEVKHKIPLSSEKIVAVTESSQVIRGFPAHLKPKSQQLNSVEITQPKVC